jgi:hypothetical protein
MRSRAAKRVSNQLCFEDVRVTFQQHGVNWRHLSNEEGFVLDALTLKQFDGAQCLARRSRWLGI